MKIELTKEKLAIIENDTQDDFLRMNQLLCDDVELFLLQEKNIKRTKKMVADDLQKIKEIYEAMIKNLSNVSSQDQVFYRGTHIAELERLKNKLKISEFLFFATEEKAKSDLPQDHSRAVLLQIKGNEEIPYLELEKKVLFAPFAKITTLQEISDNEESSDYKTYQLILQQEKLEVLHPKRQEELYENILENTTLMCEKIKICMELDDENAVHYENIRKLEQLIAKHNFRIEQENYEKDTTEEEKQSDLDDIARINTELISLKDTVSQTFKKRMKHIKQIEEWKNDIITYLKSEFAQMQSQNSKQNGEEQETQERASKEEIQFVSSGDPAVDAVKSECLENVAVVGTLLTNIKNLISKQQNHARIAEAMDSNYKALNNAFEMRNYAEELDSLVRAIATKIDTLSSKNEEELGKISKTNLQVSILLNYLNNAKVGVGKRITRFDEMNIIEENELKKEIAETIKNIRCEAELKKLTDDLDIIEEKSNIKKFFGKFTGRNKLDQTMLDQIHVRQTAIKKTFKAKMPLAYNYSIHELIAEIEMFIRENEDDELVAEEVSNLRKIRDILKKNFVIIDSKVMSIIDQKTGKNLPLASRKISKKELIEIDTYRFLNRYGYDKSYDQTEPEYQDTMASEIKRIVDYIKSSGIL